MDLLGQQFITFLRMGPQIARVFRILRVSRLFKLVKSFEEMQNLIQTLILSLPSLINVGTLLLLVFFIYAILGVFLFQDIAAEGDRKQYTIINKFNNFENFGQAMLILFRCSTGEDWYHIMFEIHTIYSTIFFISFILICSFIMLNLFVLVIIQQFEKYMGTQQTAIDVFKDNLQVFRETWGEFSQENAGFKVAQKKLLKFLYELKPPLGFDCENPEHSNKLVAKEIMGMNLLGDGLGNVYFNELLFGCMKRLYGISIVNKSPDQIKLYLLKQEFYFRKKIENIKRKIQKDESSILQKTDKSIANVTNRQIVNPIMLLLFSGMVWKAWQNYTIRMARFGGREQKSNENEFLSSESMDEQDLPSFENNSSYYSDDYCENSQNSSYFYGDDESQGSKSKSNLKQIYSLRLLNQDESYDLQPQKSNIEVEESKQQLQINVFQSNQKQRNNFLTCNIIENESAQRISNQSLDSYQESCKESEIE